MSPNVAGSGITVPSIPILSNRRFPLAGVLVLISEKVSVNT